MHVLSAVCPSPTMSDEERGAKRLHLPEPLRTRHGWGSAGLPPVGLDTHYHMAYGRTINQREASSVARTRCGHEGDERAACTVEHTEVLLRDPRQAACRRCHACARQAGHRLGLLTRLSMAHRLPERRVSKAAIARCAPGCLDGMLTCSARSSDLHAV